MSRCVSTCVLTYLGLCTRLGLCTHLYKMSRCVSTCVLTFTSQGFRLHARPELGEHRAVPAARGVDPEAHGQRRRCADVLGVLRRVAESPRGARAVSSFCPHDALFSPQPMQYSRSIPFLLAWRVNLSVLKRGFGLLRVLSSVLIFFTWHLCLTSRHIQTIAYGFILRYDVVYKIY